MTKFKVGDKVQVKPEARDYHLSGKTGVFIIYDVVHRSKRWTQYDMGVEGSPKDDQGYPIDWERANEEDIELADGELQRGGPMLGVGA